MIWWPSIVAMEIYAKEFFINTIVLIIYLHYLTALYIWFFFLNTVCKIKFKKNVFQDCIDFNIKRIYFSYKIHRPNQDFNSENPALCFVQSIKIYVTSMLHLWRNFCTSMLHLCNTRFWDLNYTFSDIIDTINNSFIIVFLYYIKGNLSIKIKWIPNGCLLNVRQTYI